MRLRKIASGDIDEYAEADAERLLSTLPFLYEKAGDEKESPKSAGEYKTRDGARHKRKDMRAEE